MPLEWWGLGETTLADLIPGALRASQVLPCPIVSAVRTFDKRKATMCSSRCSDRTGTSRDERPPNGFAVIRGFGLLYFSGSSAAPGTAPKSRTDPELEHRIHPGLPPGSAHDAREGRSHRRGGLIKS